MAITPVPEAKRRSIAQVVKEKGDEQFGVDKCQECSLSNLSCWKLPNRHHCSNCFAEGIVCASSNDGKPPSSSKGTPASSSQMAQKDRRKGTGDVLDASSPPSSAIIMKKKKKSSWTDNRTPVLPIVVAPTKTTPKKTAPQTPKKMTPKSALKRSPLQDRGRWGLDADTGIGGTDDRQASGSLKRPAGELEGGRVKAERVSLLSDPMPSVTTVDDQRPNAGTLPSLSQWDLSTPKSSGQVDPREVRPSGKVDPVGSPSPLPRIRPSGSRIKVETGPARSVPDAEDEVPPLFVPLDLCDGGLVPDTIGDNRPDHWTPITRKLRVAEVETREHGTGAERAVVPSAERDLDKGKDTAADRGVAGRLDKYVQKYRRAKDEYRAARRQSRTILQRHESLRAKNEAEVAAKGREIDLLRADVRQLSDRAIVAEIALKMYQSMQAPASPPPPPPPTAGDRPIKRQKSEQ